MSVGQWVNIFFNWCTTAVNFLNSCTILNIPVLYYLAAIFIMGVILRAILYRA